jgi:hypothetical protein
MLGAYGYKTKKELRSSIGKRLNFVETSMFGPQYKESGIVYMVGPCAYKNRRWYAKITMKDGLITKVE